MSYVRSPARFGRDLAEWALGLTGDERVNSDFIAGLLHRRWRPDGGNGSAAGRKLARLLEEEGLPLSSLDEVRQALLDRVEIERVNEERERTRLEPDARS